MTVAGAIGQYVPADSPVHALDARVKFALVVAFTFATFAVEGATGLAVLAAMTAAAVALSRVPFGVAARGVKPVLFLLVFTVVAHAVSAPAGEPALVGVGPVRVTAAGLASGAFFGGRILLLMLGTSLLTLTTSPVRLTEGLERVMRPLARVGVPVGDVAMMLTVALRFIPTTAEEAERVMLAQTARGARLGQGGPVTRARAFLPVLVPLFVNLFRRADELSMAMEARCYRGGDAPRSRLNEARMRPVDILVLALGSAVLLAVGVVL